MAHLGNYQLSKSNEGGPDEKSLIVQLDAEMIIEPTEVVRWLRGQQIKVLNKTGPRESKSPEGICKRVII